MNADIIKIIKKKEKVNKKKSRPTLRKWWNKNGYKVLRVILFPIWIYGIIQEKITKWLDNRQEWNEQRAKEILSYYVPRKSEWDEEENAFYFFDNGYGWGKLAKKYLKRKDRRFFEVNNVKLRRYLIDDFELEGFEKKWGDCPEGWTELEFELIEK